MRMDGRGVWVGAALGLAMLALPACTLEQADAVFEEGRFSEGEAGEGICPSEHCDLEGDEESGGEDPLDGIFGDPGADAPPEGGGVGAETRGKR